jgi:hypothetical protein
VAEGRPGAVGTASEVGLVDDVVDHQRGVVDEFDPDREVDGVLGLAAQRLTD